MPDAPAKSRLTQLDALLSRAAATGVASDRTAHCETPEDMVAFIADFVQVCILPRVLHTEIENVRRFSLVVSNGRILDVFDVHGKRADEASRLRAEGLTPDRAPELSRILQAEWESACQVSLTTEPSAVETNAMVGGISGAALMGSVALAPVSMLVDDMYDVFRAGIEDVLLAVLSENGELDVVADGFGISDALRADASGKLRSLEGRVGSSGTDELLLVRPFAHQDFCFALLSRKSGSEAFVLPADTMEQVAEYWAGLPNLPAGSAT